MSKELIKYLSTFVTENRLKRFEEVLQHRTRHLTVVLEDIYQPHNAAAVLRSCDCFGIQDVHVIENKNKFEASPDVELGSLKWLTLHKYNSKEDPSTLPAPQGVLRTGPASSLRVTENCIAALKKAGYKIIVTSPHKNDCSIDELDITSKTALFFGTEQRGATPVAFEQADGFVKIPMVGFTESLNISVSAAVTLYSLTSRLKKSLVNWKLSPEEEFGLRLQWLKNSIPKVELLEKEFLGRRK